MPRVEEAYTVSKMLKSINDVMAPVATSSHATVSLKRKLDNGIMLDTKPNEIALLDLQAKCKYAAQEVATLQKFGGDVKEWVDDVRRRGNELFHAAKYGEAADVYVQALTGLDFGEKPAQRRECEQQAQIPLTCNLVACLLMLEHWDKARQVCEMVLRVDAGHVRALSLRAKANAKLGRFDDARYDLEQALDRATATNASSDGVTEAKIQKQLAAVDTWEARERVHMQKQREFSSRMMRRAMGGLYQDKEAVPTNLPQPPADAASREEAIVPAPSIARWVAYFLANALLFIVRLFTGK